MALGFEARSPMLNMKAFNVEPDNKHAIKARLMSNNKINFGKKKGFTLYDDKEKLADFFYKSICLGNDHYHLISNSFLLAMGDRKQKYFGVIKKFYILFEWFQANSITYKSLNGFTIP
jgi:hypothetical protein